MSEIEEKNIEVADDKKDRRDFFKQFGKYFLGFTAFAIASLFGLKHDGELRLGKMKDMKLGLSEAHATCSSSMNCAGGGGQCSSSMNCAGS